MRFSDGNPGTGEKTRKAVLLDGDIDKEGTLEPVPTMLMDELVAAGFELERFAARKLEIAPCQGCFGCWIRTPGTCLIHDASAKVVRAFVGADLLIFLTPMTFGGYSSELKKVLDRAICCISPFFMTIAGQTHHKPRYRRAPRILGVGVTSDFDAECVQIFKSLVQRNAVNLHAPRHAAAVIDRSTGRETVRSEILQVLDELENAG